MSAVADAPAQAPATASEPATSSPTLVRAARRHPWAPRVVGVLAIMALSVWLRTHALDAKFWIDEGLSVGIAHHDLWHIPGVLRQDGSPPLYYMLLHVWMGVVGGDGESRTHALSVLFATLTIPAAWVAGRRLFGERAAWASAALCATLPFLTYYAQETRMYALVALLGTCASGAFAIAYGRGERWAIPLFGVLTAATVYTHNWGLFLAVGMGVAFLVLLWTTPPERRGAFFRDGLLGFGLLLALYAPWIPTLLFQARHTGAPWAEAPDFGGLLTGLQNLVGGLETALMVFVVGMGGVLTLRHDHRERWRAAVALGVVLAVGVGLAWLASQASPAWSTRYFSVFIGPALLLAGAGLTRFGKVGLVALAIALVLWFNPRERAIRSKSDAYRVATTLKQQGLVAPGDLVVAVHPEYGPVMRYYLGGGYQWADALGKVRDDRVFDWRDALARFRAAGPRRTLAQLEPMVQPGQHLVLILPIIRTASWGAPWTGEIRRRAPQWEQAVDADDRFIRVKPVPRFGDHALPRGVRAIVYLRK
ncbi:MAG TPA: glycosyltransferase family 39 protein [Baekduia sp.]|uniref:glycosyltransferase family 39 protein n=1 Tax=Baekduia sp. TaxID=2600305 RepID=UPI002D795441|nr:glycosyltransferase family 39 protein [Baekduia sp.]HET6508225.1 glycosyltransferase family 39 protein [Baekduia sp.]